MTQTELQRDFSTVTLRDGRPLAYTECGNPYAEPVMLFHGLPGSRLERHPDADACRDARLICIDRPGFGASSPKRDRELLDWPQDVAELADHLGLGRFSIIAWSGGGPFGLACSYALPDRVQSLLLVSSLAPLDEERHYAGMVTSNWLLFQCAKYAPALVCVPVGILGAVASWNAAWRLDGLAESLCQQDREMLESGALRELMLADTAEALRQGYGAAEREVTLVSRDWGFPLEEVRVPVTILHGEKDAITPPSMAQALAERLPRSRLIMRREAGHFLLFRHWRAAVRMVLKPR